ncbi:MAG: TonB-dependent receptor plug domain-containing protein [Prolixibacteraceae bacterium]|nr:TonB-dependent receptor plug domain-containing protein [Prolixibacteraceae bacterium]
MKRIGVTGEGMGFLFFFPEASMTYYAFCTNEKGIQKKFELPPAQPDALSLKTLWSKGMLTVSVNHSPNIQLTQPLYLIMHCRGVPLYNDVWNNNSQYLQFPQEIMPSGIINILLVDQNMNPISERMIFNTNELEQVSVTFETDKSNYQKRDAVSAKIKLADANNNPLKGSMSISITDDKDVKPDTCNNIFTALLLASELKGYIESPAYYFSGDESNSRTLQTQLDALMLTQGWTRYNVPAVIKGEIEKPTSYLEAGFVISGTVKGGVMMTNASKESIVSLISHNYPFFDTTTSDENGKFIFAGFELPDTVNYIVQASSPKGGTRFELSLDENLSPPIKKQMLWEYSGDRTNNPDFENYMSKAEEKFVIENGVRTIFLKEVTVVGKAKEKVNRSPFSSPFNQIVSEEEIEKMRAIDMRMILMRLSGVIVSGNTVRIRNNPGDPLVLVDNMETDMDMLLNFQVLDIAEIEVFKDATAAIFGSRGGNGVILITTKSGEVPTRQREKYNMKIYQPLGYQVVKEFYMPAYDTPERKRSSEPDLRTTVYWNPNVNSSAETGEAQVNFFAADTSTTYSVIIEGMTPDGQIIRSVQKIRRED